MSKAIVLTACCLVWTCCLSGADVVSGAQKALYAVKNHNLAFRFPDYSNNGYEQRVKVGETSQAVEVLVDNPPLDSRLPAVLPEPLPHGLESLELTLKAPRCRYIADQVTAIIDWIHREIVYVPTDGGDQDVASVVNQKRGNCIGLSNLAIFLLEKISVKARYVTGIAFKQDDKALLLLEGGVLHRWIEIQYEDVGPVFSDPSGKVNFVDGAYLVLGVESVHPIAETLALAVSSRVELVSLVDGFAVTGSRDLWHPGLTMRPNLAVQAR